MREFVPHIFVRICFSRATSDIFARVFLRLLVCIFENSRFSCFFGAVGALFVAICAFFVFFSCFSGFCDFRVFRVFRDFRAPGGFRGFDFAFFCFSLIFVIFSGSFGHFSFSRFSRVFTVIRRFCTANRTLFHAIIFLVAWRSLQMIQILQKTEHVRNKQAHCGKFVSIKPTSSGSTPHMKIVRGMKAPCASHGSGEKWI